MQLTLRTPRRCAAALVAAAIASTLTACSGGDGTEPRRPAREARAGQGWVRVAAPNTIPRATVAVGGDRFVPKILAQDWSAKGGVVHVPAERVTWRRVPRGSGWVLRIGSAVAPARVVLYRYRSVGHDGAPDAAPAIESVCTAADAKCTVSAPRARGNVLVTPRRLPHRGYFLVQATWLVPPGDSASAGEVSVTWAFAATSDDGS